MAWHQSQHTNQCFWAIYESFASGLLWFTQETIDRLLAQGIGGEGAKIATAATTKANSVPPKAGNGGKGLHAYTL